MLKFVMVYLIYPNRGGIAHYTSLLSRSLMDRGHELHIISLRRQYPSLLYPGNSNKDPSQSGIRLDANYDIDPISPWTWINATQK